MLRWGSSVPMVLILDGHSEIGAHVGRDCGNLICLRHLVISRAAKDRIFFIEHDLFFFMLARLDLSYYLI